jgi:hypothetical protein
MRFSRWTLPAEIFRVMIRNDNWLFTADPSLAAAYPDRAIQPTLPRTAFGEVSDCAPGGSRRTRTKVGLWCSRRTWPAARNTDRAIHVDGLSIRNERTAHKFRALRVFGKAEEFSPGRSPSESSCRNPPSPISAAAKR